MTTEPNIGQRVRLPYDHGAIVALDAEYVYAAGVHFLPGLGDSVEPIPWMNRYPRSAFTAWKETVKLEEKIKYWDLANAAFERIYT